jgi:hypothetical protein
MNLFRLLKLTAWVTAFTISQLSFAQPWLPYPQQPDVKRDGNFMRPRLSRINCTCPIVGGFIGCHILEQQGCGPGGNCVMSGIMPNGPGYTIPNCATVEDSCRNSFCTAWVSDCGQNTNSAIQEGKHNESGGWSGSGDTLPIPPSPVPQFYQRSCVPVLIPGDL